MWTPGLPRGPWPLARQYPKNVLCPKTHAFCGSLGVMRIESGPGCYLGRSAGALACLARRSTHQGGIAVYGIRHTASAGEHEVRRSAVIPAPRSIIPFPAVLSFDCLYSNSPTRSFALVLHG
jgi:hypothetical protein